MVRSVVLALVSVAAACHEASSSPLPPAETAPICGQDGPVQVLALDERDIVSPRGKSIWVVGERWLVGIRRFELAVLDIGLALTIAPDRPSTEVAGRIESIDPCGGDRRVIAEGPDVPLPPIDGGGPWLGGRSRDGRLYWIDPTGSRAAVRLPELEPVKVARRGDGLIAMRKAERDLVTIARDGDTLTIAPVLADVVQTSVMSPWGPAPPEIIALTDDAELHLLDLATLDDEVIATDVGGFDTSTDLRWLAYWPGVPGGYERPTEAWYVDRDADETIAFAFPEGGELDVVIAAELIAFQHYSGGLVDQTVLIALPDQQTLTQPFDLRPVATDGAGRYVVQASSFTGIYSVYGIVAGELVSLGPIGGDSYFDGAMWSTSTQDDGTTDVVRYPLSTLRPEQVVSGALSTVALPRERWARVDGADGRSHGLGDLVVVDGVTGESSMVDADVFNEFAPLSPSYQPLPPGPWSTSELVYEVRERYSDRNGLWRVAFE